MTIVALLGFLGYRLFSKPSYSCMFVIEPYIPKNEFYDVDDVVKYSIDEHQNIISGRGNIRNAIHSYSLDKLYGENAIALRNEIEKSIETTQLSRGKK